MLVHLAPLHTGQAKPTSSEIALYPRLDVTLGKITVQVSVERSCFIHAG